jgi:DHA1 family tetracycline resistance protein-like MFS transporter
MAWNRERRALTIVLLALLIDTIGFGIIAPVMPDLIVDLTHQPLSEAARLSGWLLFVFATMQFLFSPVMGGLGDHFGRRPVLLLSMLAFGLDYLVMAIAPSFAWLFVSRAIAGITGATFVPAGAYVADVTPPERRAQNFGLIGAAFGVGFVIGPALGGVLGELGPRAPFVAAAVLAIANATFGYFLLPESLPPERRRPFRLVRSNPLGTLASLRRNPGTLVLFAAWFLWMLAHWVYPSTWAFFTKVRFGWSDAQIGGSLALLGFSMAIAQAFVTRRLIPAVGERSALLLGMSIGIAGFLANAFASSAWVVYVVLSASALQGLVFPSMNATLSRHVGANEQGELQGGIASLQSISAILGPPMLTHVFSHFTRPEAPVYFPGAAFLLSACLATCSLATVALFARRAFVHDTPARDG